MYAESANYKSNSTEQVQVPSITNDLDSLFGSMREVFSRLQKVGDTLRGPMPREAGVDKTSPPEAKSARRLLDLCQRTASEIHDELSRIERNI